MYARSYCHVNLQERIAKAHGSQCGFCTPGIVMSMYTLLRNNTMPTEEEMEKAFEGNINDTILLSMCVLVCVCVCHIRLSVCVCACACVCICVCVCTHVCCKCVCVCMCVCVCVYVCVCRSHVIWSFDC